MKVAVITLYDYYNYGSFLQAYAMQCFLEQKGHEVYFVRTQSLKRRIRRGMQKANKENLLFNVNKLCKFQQDFKRLRQINVDDIKKYKIDGIIIGSDELWNADNDAFNQFPFYYGIGLEDIPKIVFAMSLGNGSYKTLLKKEYISDGIKTLPEIYARDYSAAEAIGKIAGRKIDIVCDPTLLLNKKVYDEMPNNYKMKPYILVYSYNMPEFLQDFILKIAKKQGLQVISACFPLRIADKVVNCTPREFPQIVKNAEYVVTSTFHGSIFSFIFNKKFIVLPYAKKTVDFLKLLHLEEVIIDEECTVYEYEQKTLRDVDFSKANLIVDNMRARSRNILIDFLEKL